MISYKIKIGYEVNVNQSEYNVNYKKKQIESLMPWRRQMNIIE